MRSDRYDLTRLYGYDIIGLYMPVGDNHSLTNQAVFCPVCGSGEICLLWSDTICITDRSYSYSFLKCSRCRLHFMYPLPDPLTIDAFYRSLEGRETYGPYVFNDHSVAEKYPRLKMWIAESRFPEKDVSMAKRLKQAVAVIAECLAGRLVSFTLGVPLQYPPDVPMLDLGCGAGDWLLYMTGAGYQNVMGQDIAGPSLVRLQEYGITVAVGELGDLGLRDSSFDLVRMEHVLEHLPDPVAYLSEVHRLLRPGGRLLITSPCIDSLSYRLARQRWQPLQPLYHLHHFSLRSLRFLGQKSNMQLRRYRYLPVYDVMIASVFHDCPAIARYLRMRPVRILLEPLYGLAMRLLKTGDFLTAEFIRPTTMQ